MADVLLIDRDDVMMWRPVSTVIDETLDLTPYIREAQDIDIRPTLGDALYYDMLTNVSQQKYVDLLGGIDYTDSANNTVSFRGLKAALSYFFWARYIDMRGVVDSPAGFIRGNLGQYAESLDRKTIDMQANKARQIGDQYLFDCKKFLRLNTTTYTKYLLSDKKPLAGATVKYHTI